MQLIKKTIKKYVRYISRLEAEPYTLIVLLIADVFFLLGIVGGSAWITLIFLAVIGLLVLFKIRDLTTSILLISIYTFQFYTPNKYYPVEVFRSYELTPSFGNYILSYGIHIKNVFLTMLILLLVWEGIKHKKNIIREDLKTIVYLIIVPFLIYLLSSLYSSVKYSPHLSLSLVWLFHNVHIFVVGFLVYFFYINKPKLIKLLYTPILATIFLQGILAVRQFFAQSWAGLPIENARYASVYFGAPDAVKLLFRVVGTFGHSNQFAVVMGMLLVIVLPVVVTGKKWVSIWGVLLGTISILLTQSRSGWIGLSVALLLAGVFYKKDIENFVNSIGKRKFVLLSSLLFIIGLIIVFPRIIASFNAFEAGGSVALRVEMAKESLTAFIQSPLVGYGVGTNETTLLKLFPLGYVYSFPAPIHMAYAQILLESGIFGLLALMFPFVYSIRTAIDYLIRFGKMQSNKIKSTFYIAIAGTCLFCSYYLFQPEEGFREFYYIGIILGYCLISFRNIHEISTKN